MKNTGIATAVAFVLGVSPAVADPTFMLGGTLSFGASRPAEFGVSARLLENNRSDESTLGAGITYYPRNGDIGLDVFAGYIFDQGVFGFGYDFVQATPVVSLGIANTED